MTTETIPDIFQSKSDQELLQLAELLVYLDRLSKVAGDHLILGKAAAVEYINGFTNATLAGTRTSQVVDIAGTLNNHNYPALYRAVLFNKERKLSGTKDEYLDELDIILQLLAIRANPSRKTDDEAVIAHLQNDGWLAQYSTGQKVALLATALMGAALLAVAWMIDFGRHFGFPLISTALSVVGALCVVAAYVISKYVTPVKSTDDEQQPRVSADPAIAKRARYVLVQKEDLESKVDAAIAGKVREKVGRERGVVIAAATNAQVKVDQEVMLNTSINTFFDNKNKKNATAVWDKLQRYTFWGVDLRASSSDGHINATVNFKVQNSGEKIENTLASTIERFLNHIIEAKANQPQGELFEYDAIWSGNTGIDAVLKLNEIWQDISAVQQTVHQDQEAREAAQQTALIKAIKPLLEWASTTAVDNKNIEALNIHLAGIGVLPTLKWEIGADGKIAVVITITSATSNIALDESVRQLVAAVLEHSLEPNAESRRELSDAALKTFCEKFNVNEFADYRVRIRNEREHTKAIQAVGGTINDAQIKSIRGYLAYYKYNNIKVSIDETTGKTKVDSITYTNEPLSPAFDQHVRKYIGTVLDRYMHEHPGKPEFVSEQYLDASWVGAIQVGQAGAFITPEAYKTLKEAYDRRELGIKLEGLTKITRPSAETLYKAYQDYLPKEVTCRKGEDGKVTVVRTNISAANGEALNEKIIKFIEDVLNYSLTDMTSAPDRDAEFVQSFCADLDVKANDKNFYQEVWRRDRMQKALKDFSDSGGTRLATEVTAANANALYAQYQNYFPTGKITWSKESGKVVVATTDFPIENGEILNNEIARYIQTVLSYSLDSFAFRHIEEAGFVQQCAEKFGIKEEFYQEFWRRHQLNKRINELPAGNMRADSINQILNDYYADFFPKEVPLSEGKLDDIAVLKTGDALPAEFMPENDAQVPGLNNNIAGFIANVLKESLKDSGDGRGLTSDFVAEFSGKFEGEDKQFHSVRWKRHRLEKDINAFLAGTITATPALAIVDLYGKEYLPKDVTWKMDKDKKITVQLGDAPVGNSAELNTTITGFIRTFLEYSIASTASTRKFDDLAVKNFCQQFGIEDSFYTGLWARQADVAKLRKDVYATQPSMTGSHNVTNGKVNAILEQLSHYKCAGVTFEADENDAIVVNNITFKENPPLDPNVTDEIKKLVSAVLNFHKEKNAKISADPKYVDLTGITLEHMKATWFGDGKTVPVDETLYEKIQAECTLIRNINSLKVISKDTVEPIIAKLAIYKNKKVSITLAEVATVEVGSVNYGDDDAPSSKAVLGKIQALVKRALEFAQNKNETELEAAGIGGTYMSEFFTVVGVDSFDAWNEKRLQICTERELLADLGKFEQYRNATPVTADSVETVQKKIVPHVQSITITTSQKGKLEIAVSLRENVVDKKHMTTTIEAFVSRVHDNAIPKKPTFSRNAEAVAVLSPENVAAFCDAVKCNNWQKAAEQGHNYTPFSTATSHQPA